MAGGKWRRFKASRVTLESSHSLASAARVARTSLVLVEMSCEEMDGGPVRLNTRDEQQRLVGRRYLNEPTVGSLSIFCRPHDGVADVFV